VPADLTVGTLYEKGISVKNGPRHSAALYLKAPNAHRQGDAQSAVLEPMAAAGRQYTERVAMGPQGGRPRVAQPVQPRHPLCALHRVEQNLADSFKWFRPRRRAGRRRLGTQTRDVAKGATRSPLARQKLATRHARARPADDAVMARPAGGCGRSTHAGSSPRPPRQKTAWTKARAR